MISREIDWRAVLHAGRDDEQVFYRATSTNRTAPSIARVCNISVSELIGLNPDMLFPVEIGTSVRIA